MSSQTLWRTRMMFVSFNIALKWFSYGNQGHFSRVCRGALWNYEWNGIFYCSAPSQQDPGQVGPDYNLSLRTPQGGVGLEYQQ